jgi:hypothetical protein
MKIKKNAPKDIDEYIAGIFSGIEDDLLGGFGIYLT